MIGSVGKLVGALVVALAVTVSGAWADCGHCGKGPAAATAKSCCEKHAAGQKQECCEKHAAGQKQACCETAKPAAKPAAGTKDCCAKAAAGQKQDCCAKRAAGKKQPCCESGDHAGSRSSVAAEPAPAATLPVAQAPGGAADRTQLSPGMQSLMQKVDELRRRRGQ